MVEEKEVYNVDIDESIVYSNTSDLFKVVNDHNTYQVLAIKENIDIFDESILNVDLENREVYWDSLCDNLCIKTIVNNESQLISKDKNITIRIECKSANIYGFKPEGTVIIDDNTYYCYSTLFAYFEIYATDQIIENMYFYSNYLDNNIYDYYIYICQDTEDYYKLFIPYEFYNLTINCHTFDFTHDKSNGTQTNEVTNVTIKESLVLKDSSKVKFNNLKIEGVLSMDDNTELTCKTLEL